MNLKVGDPVEVIDSGLAMLRKLGAGINHHGWVQELDYGGTGDILVEFPIGDDDPDEHSQVAPYPANCVIRREGERR